MTDLGVLCRALLDDESLNALAGDAAGQRRLWELAIRNEVHLCLAWRLTHDARASWVGGIQHEVRAALADAAVLEELRRRELLAVTKTLAAAGVEALLLKGAALAYQVYADPMLRPRDDTDLLIRERDLPAAAGALLSAGYEPANENTAPLATAQRHFRRVDGRRVSHPVDVHWRVTNPLAYADALPFDRVRDRSVAVSALDGARALGVIDALMLACLHRLAHHGEDSSAIWVYDIHLLARTLSGRMWDELRAEAGLNGLSGACAQGLVRARDLFGTAVPSGTLAELVSAARPAEQAFFRPRIGPLGMLASDWQVTDSWRGRLRLLGAHMFPQPAYIAAKYGTRNPVLLPFLYAHRALAGLPRWLAGPRG